MRQKNFTFLQMTNANLMPSRIKFYLQRLALAVVLFAGMGIPYASVAQVFTSTSLTVVASPKGAGTTSTTYYGARPTNSNPKFNGAQLATADNPIDPFNASGTLVISMVADAINPRGTAITASRFYYRVYSQGAAAANKAD